MRNPESRARIEQREVERFGNARKTVGKCDRWSSVRANQSRDKARLPRSVWLSGSIPWSRREWCEKALRPGLGRGLLARRGLSALLRATRFDAKHRDTVTLGRGKTGGSGLAALPTELDPDAGFLGGLLSLLLSHLLHNYPLRPAPQDTKFIT